SSRPLILEKSPFQFIKPLQEGKRGDRKEGIHQLKQYLHNFGYLNDTQYSLSTEVDANLFDENMERAIITYQINFNLNSTGVLDAETVATMMKPRCGVADIVDGKTRMKASGREYHLDYAFFHGNPKWPLSKKVLTWRLLRGSRQDAAAPIRDFALRSWDGVAPFQYKQVGEHDASDIKIGFRTKATDPEGEMDGPGGTLGYAFPPKDGHMYFDGDENWGIDGPTPEQFDLGTVALHELGHILGLQHSSDPGAIMFPTNQKGAIKGLGPDDEGKRGDKKEGVLDDETVATMTKPRCGVADIVDGETRMKASGRDYHLDYAFFHGKPKWPLSKKVLTWRLLHGSRQDAAAPIRDFAMRSWDGVAPFHYKQIGENDATDIKIGFLTKATDPKAKMDGPGGILAYSYPPEDGHMYFDADENWGINGPTPEQYDLGTVALHELGHILGLQHSSDPGAIMFPTTQKGTVKGLGPDDYKQVGENDASDIKFGFRTKAIDPEGNMDGPRNGHMYFDGDENWGINGPTPEQYDMGTVATLTFFRPCAIMFPSTQKGTVKGLGPDDVAGIKALFGYLNTTQYSQSTNVDADLFDENMERAIRIYQINFNLNSTGVLDGETVATMMMPRCGLPDIVDGKTRMMASRRDYHLHYSFFSGNPTWPLSKKELTWRLLPGSRQDAIVPIREHGFLQWEVVCPFRFRQIGDNDPSDIHIGFQTKATDPWGQADGPGGHLAYAYGPTNGHLYFDGDENWAMSAPTPQQFDLGTVALHELGHILGLQHSSDPDAIMWPTTPPGKEGKRGDKKEGIHQLKQYLHRFGYLNTTQYSLSTETDADLFDEHMERAIRIYQINFNLNSTGVLDGETVATMMMPRCGVADIIDGKTRMKASGRDYHLDYAFFKGSPKWPLSRKVLTWRLLHGSRQDAIAPIRDYALLSWAGVAPFHYNQVGENAASDIKIGFRTKATDPVGKMDGPAGLLAYSYPPQDGHMYFDGDENWAINGPTPEQFDLGTVALHELGHILGLEHSSDPGAIMFPTTPKGTIKGLGPDDIAGIKALYNLP
ncbi:hypothetical protein Tsubulata_026936, partial [Turnera subulata]